MPLKKHTTKHRDSFIGKLVLSVAIIEPLMTLPQIYKIWSGQNAQGVSTLTWFFYMISAIIWLIYGVKIKDKPIITASVLWVITEGLVVLGTLIY